ncbi:interferon regulatory factor 3 isoform X2 [Oryx dammah]|uniref:interferon regulatory factor 3 isoform X2 n=1 Tax=Oryx dammah TaxID=59534 RepID=UPI001A9BAD15|nr:interferon regulatory factor 3 isoform X2 [Oryx dammah]XP_040108193.1 interferon regulatory factor 3 isoform X2 [Oryx dammah]
MGTQKPRILPWLISQLDRGELEGVAWLGESRTRFRIPWKHGLRQDAQQEDFGIFQESGTSLSQTPLKTMADTVPLIPRVLSASCELRTSLSLIMLMSVPGKVLSEILLRLLCPGLLKKEDIVQKLLSDMDLSPEGGHSNLTMASENPPQLLLSPESDIPALCPNSGLSENPLKQLLANEEDWEFEVTAFYRGCQVFQQTVFCPGGLRLVGSEAGDRMLPGQPIRLPDPAASLTDKSVTDYVQRVLSCLGGGLALWRAGQWLYAQRLGHCHVYWAIGEELLPSCGHKPDGEVPKDREGGVFNLGPFITDLITFTEGSRRSPLYTLWFCVGQSWPQDQPWIKRLVMVKVVPMCLRVLVDIARQGGASSLENTVDLHISNSQPLSLTPDQYMACLQDLAEDMDF